MTRIGSLKLRNRSWWMGNFSKNSNCWYERRAGDEWTEGRKERGRNGRRAVERERIVINRTGSQCVPRP